jgi:V/A-type H+/Na+-transporting ATPase subunit I
MFRPVPVVRLSVYVLDEHMSRVSWALAQLGLVHLVDVARLPGASQQSTRGNLQEVEQRYDLLVERSRRLMERLGLEYQPRLVTGPVLPESDLGELEERLSDLERTLPARQDRLASLSEEQQKKSRQKNLLRLLLDSDPALDMLRRSPRLAVRVGVVATENVATLQERSSGFPHLLELLGDLGPGRTFVAAAPAGERVELDKVLEEAGCQVTALPERSARELLAEVERDEAQVAAELRSTEQAFREGIAEAHAPLSALRRKGEIAATLLKARRHFGHTARLALISGWVPRDKLAEVRKTVLEVTGGSAYLESEDPREIRGVRDGTLRVPILLANPLLLRPFEKLVTTYGAPEYSEVEPTAFLAITFLLMFGVMFGDVGQGGLLAAVGYGLFRISPQHTDLGVLLMECGASSIIFGFLWGSVFGVENFIAPLWFRPMQNLPSFLLFAISFGALMISIGLVLNIVNTWRSEGALPAIFGERGLLGALIYWIALALVARFLLTGASPESRSIALLVGVPAVTIVLYSPIEQLLARWRETPLSKKGGFALVIESLIGLGDTFLGLLTNTVSFLRIAAFSLAHVGLFTAVFALANNLSQLQGGGVWYWLALIGGNLFIVLLEGLLASIQAIRLEYYEFFGKFFKGQGELFRPLHV